MYTIEGHLLRFGHTPFDVLSIDGTEILEIHGGLDGAHVVTRKGRYHITGDLRREFNVHREDPSTRDPRREESTP
jgi:hypothetical protein